MNVMFRWRPCSVDVVANWDVVDCSITVCYMEVITNYGLGYGRSLLPMYCRFGWALVLPYPFVDLVSRTPWIMNGKTYLFTDGTAANL